MASPIIHPLHDPNGPKISRLRKRVIDDIGFRIKQVEREIRRIVTDFLTSHQVGTKQVNHFEINLDSPTIELNKTKYLYQVEQAEINAVDQLIARIVNQWVMDGQGLWSPQWYLNQYMTPAWETGASESLQSLKNISPAVVVGNEISTEIRGLDIQQLLMTPAYRRPIELLSSRTFNSMEGLSGDMIKDLRFILSQSIADGISARDAARRISAKLWPDEGGYKYRALRIARTEINSAFRQAYMEVNDDMNNNVFDKGGFKTMLMHISALTPTTRRTHAARHGLTYTSDEQSTWWSEDGNSVNCQCSITSVLVDKKTGEVLQQNLYKKAQEQGKAFFAVR